MMISFDHQGFDDNGKLSDRLRLKRTNNRRLRGIMVKWKSINSVYLAPEVSF
jgi:hypothetical protein